MTLIFRPRGSISIQDPLQLDVQLARNFQNGFDVGLRGFFIESDNLISAIDATKSDSNEIVANEFLKQVMAKDKFTGLRDEKYYTEERFYSLCVRRTLAIQPKDLESIGQIRLLLARDFVTETEKLLSKDLKFPIVKVKSNEVGAVNLRRTKLAIFRVMPRQEHHRV